MRLDFFKNRARLGEKEIKALTTIGEFSCHVDGVDLECIQCPYRCNEDYHYACISALALEIIEAEERSSQ